MSLLLANALVPASLTSFDWFLVIVAGVSTLFAFMKGFIRVLFSLVGLTVGLLLASWNYVRLATWLERWVSSMAAAEAVGFVVILCGVMIVFSLAAGFVRRTAKAVGLGFVDRVLGAGVGLARGVLLGVAAMAAVAAFDPHSRLTKNSVLAPYFLAGARAVSFVVPTHLQQQMSEGTRHLVEKSPDLVRRSALSK